MLQQFHQVSKQLKGNQQRKDLPTSTHGPRWKKKKKMEGDF